MKLKKDAQIIERAEKKVFLVLGDKEICISDEPEMEAVVNKLFFANDDIEEAMLKRLDDFVEEV